MYGCMGALGEGRRRRETGILGEVGEVEGGGVGGVALAHHLLDLPDHLLRQHGHGWPTRKK